MPEITNKIAVVTGANKGIGFEICKQLASKGVTVILGARDEKRGVEAVEKLQEFGLSDRVVLHRIDVTDSATTASLAEFVKSKFGKLDMLMNNAGITGSIVDGEALRVASKDVNERKAIDWSKILTEDYDTATTCFETNYYGVKRTTKALLPLLQLSESPRIVMVSSMMGQLKNIPSEWAKGVLSDVESLEEDKIDQVVNEFLKSSKEGTQKVDGWPEHFGPYIVSKAVMNAYTRLLAKQCSNIVINSVCPGFTKTDINHNTGVQTVEEGAENPVRLAFLPDDGPSGLFFDRKEMSHF